MRGSIRAHDLLKKIVFSCFQVYTNKVFFKSYYSLTIMGYGTATERLPSHSQAVLFFKGKFQ